MTEMLRVHLPPLSPEVEYPRKLANRNAAVRLATVGELTKWVETAGKTIPWKEVARSLAILLFSDPDKGVRTAILQLAVLDMAKKQGNISLTQCACAAAWRLFKEKNQPAAWLSFMGLNDKEGDALRHGLLLEPVPESTFDMDKIRREMEREEKLFYNPNAFDGPRTNCPGCHARPCRCGKW